MIATIRRNVCPAMANPGNFSETFIDTTLLYLRDIVWETTKVRSYVTHVNNKCYVRDQKCRRKYDWLTLRADPFVGSISDDINNTDVIQWITLWKPKHLPCVRFVSTLSYIIWHAVLISDVSNGYFTIYDKLAWQFFTQKYPFFVILSCQDSYKSGLTIC